jgi:alpha-D-ribose 1-methylphosphonate 5-triphosphate synthase subunit PhnL
MGGRIHRFNENVEKNQLMKSQPLNMVFGPARLAPRTCSPSDRAGFVFSASTTVTDWQILLLDTPKSSRLTGNRRRWPPS